MAQLTLEDTQALLKGVLSFYTLKDLDTFTKDSLSILEELITSIVDRADSSKATMRSHSLDWQDSKDDCEMLLEDDCLLCSSWQDLTDRDRLTLELIQSHLVRADRIIRHLQQIRQQLTQLQQTLARTEERVLSWLSVLELLGLSEREAEVLFWIIRGKENKAIATQLKIQSSTVRKHLENIYRKLDVRSRTEAIALALDKVGMFVFDSTVSEPGWNALPGGEKAIDIARRSSQVLEEIEQTY